MVGESRFQDFLLYIEKSAICVKNSDGRGRFKIRKSRPDRGASKYVSFRICRAHIDLLEVREKLHMGCVDRKFGP